MAPGAAACDAPPAGAFLSVSPSEGGCAGLAEVRAGVTGGELCLDVVGFEGRRWVVGERVRLCWHAGQGGREAEGAVVAGGAGGSLRLRMEGQARPAPRASGLRVPFPFPLRFSRLGRDLALVRRQRQERLAVHVGRPPAAEAVGGDAGSDGVRETLTALAKLLAVLEVRLDRLEALLRHGPGALPDAETAQGVALGREAVRMAVQSSLERGEVLELELRLPLFPPLPLVAFAWVTDVARGSRREGCDARAPAVEAEAQFIGLHEEDEALLMAYLLRRQREALRARRGKVAG